MRTWLVMALLGCNAPGMPPPPPMPGPVAITAVVNSTRFVTREHMLAAAEMQISGEPLAEAMNRTLANYSRDRIPTDLYFDPYLVLSWTDLAGFSTAIESYEYSKQPMNMLAFESGAGTDLAAGPLVTDLAADIQHYASGANTLGRFVFATGWPGMLPTLHVFTSFDPAIDPTSDIALGCAITSDDDPDGMTGTKVINGDYECDATSLHLRDRASQIDSTISPGADGFSGWKYGLWVMNYLQVMHDSMEAPIANVPEGDLAGVGSGDVFLGSSDIEGFQAQLFIAMMDNRAEDWLEHLSTTDGVTLSGFGGQALAYNYASPLRWFPGAVAVPSNTITSAQPDVLDLDGMILGYAEMLALTDPANRDVGGSQPVRAFFDGDPFVGTAVHDRALGMLRVAIIDLDRMTTPTTTTEVAYTAIAERTALRALSSQLELYSNNTPDTAVTTSPLDMYPLAYPGDASLTFSGRLAQLLRANAELLWNQLTDPSGRAFTGVDQADVLDAHTAAIRGLFTSYLATGDVMYRDRAVAVFERMERTFYDPIARIWSETPAPVDSVEMTPLRFALLQSALRDMYELVATRPGEAARIAPLEDHLARLDKLVLNGWDDRDQNRLITWPDECANVVDGLPRGGLQMAERTLTGELGSLQAPLLPTDTRTVTSDREHDCVPEIDDAHLPAALADSVTFEIHR
ncbi:MAG: hypothetical protein QM831_11405 [Kofleriaceae bacterium]